MKTKRMLLIVATAILSTCWMADAQETKTCCKQKSDGVVSMWGFELGTFQNSVFYEQRLGTYFSIKGSLGLDVDFGFLPDSDNLRVLLSSYTGINPSARISTRWYMIPTMYNGHNNEGPFMALDLMYWWGRVAFAKKPSDTSVYDHVFALQAGLGYRKAISEHLTFKSGLYFSLGSRLATYNRQDPKKPIRLKEPEVVGKLDLMLDLGISYRF